MHSHHSQPTQISQPCSRADLIFFSEHLSLFFPKSFEIILVKKRKKIKWFLEVKKKTDVPGEVFLTCQQLLQEQDAGRLEEVWLSQRA